MSQDDMLQEFKPAMEGLTITAADRGAGRVVNPTDIPKITLSFANLNLKDGSGNVIVDVNGTVTLGAGVRKIWEKGSFELLPHEAGLYGLAYVSGQLTAHAHAAGSFTADVPLTLKGPGIPVGLLGALGVTANAQLFLKIQGSFSADGTFVATATINASAGVHYDSKSHWSFDKTFDKDFSLQPPSLRAQVDIGVSLIRPSFSISVLDAATVGIKADVMQVLAKITGQTSPTPGFLVEGYGDFAFTGYGNFNIGPWTLWHDERSFDLGKFSIIKPFLLKTLSATDTKIAYLEATGGKLHTMNGDGTGDSVLYTANVGALTPDVSNANKKVCLIVLDAKTYSPKLYTISGSGSDKVSTVIGVGSLQPANPVWSPDGSEIAFDAADTAGVRQIYVVNLSTTNVRQLTHWSNGGGEEPKVAGRATTNDSTEPTWSADGTKIVYQRYYFGVTSIGVTSSTSDTYNVVLANDALSYSDPSLSPSGSLLVCRRSTRGIVVSSDTGANEHTIVADTRYSHPRWSPDGTRIVMQDDTAGKIVSCDLNGGDLKTLATGKSPAWGLR